MRPAADDLDQRRPVWMALSDLFLDTDPTLAHDYIVRVLAASSYSLEELDAILREEVQPACGFNLSLVAGEWAGFAADFLEKRILCGGPPPRPWWRRLQRHLMLGDQVTSAGLSEEWALLRRRIASVRTGNAGGEALSA